MANFQTHKIKATYKPTAHSDGDTENQSSGGVAVEIPNNAVIVSQIYHVVKALTAASGTPKIAVNVGGAAFIAATDYNNSAFAVRTIGGAAAAKLSTTATTKLEVVASNGAGDITGGQIDFYVEYVTTDEA